MKQNYSTLDIVKALEIPRERFREWLTRGYIKPQKPARGHGKAAVFTIEDVWMVALFRNLIENGYKRDVAGAFLDKIYYSAKSDKDTVHLANVLVVWQAKSSDTDEIIVQAAGSRVRAEVICIFCEQGGVTAMMPNLAKAHSTFDDNGQYQFEKALSMPLRGLEANDKWTNIQVVNFGLIREETTKALRLIE